MDKKKGYTKIKNKTRIRSSKIPSRLGRLFVRYICDVTGKNELDNKVLERIRQYVITQKSGYWGSKPSGRYGKSYDVFAYLAYQAPVYLVQFYYLIKKLDNEGLLPKDIKLLDLGTGPGIVPLSFIWYNKERKLGLIEINVIEQSEEFLKAFNYLVPEFINQTPEISIKNVIQADIRSLVKPPFEKVNLITIQNVLAELSDLSTEKILELLKYYIKWLSDDGFFIIVEPAEFRHSTRLREIQVELIKSGFYVYSPCKYFRNNICNPDKCWSFCKLPGIEPTQLMRSLAGEDEAYRFLNTDIKFSYLVCLKNNRRFVTKPGIPEDTTPLNCLDEELGNNVDVIVSKMSPDIGDRQYAIFYICDGTGRKKTYLIIPRDISGKNLSLAFTSDYGEVIYIHGVRVRWNPKKEAYNLIAGSSSKITGFTKFNS